MIERELFEYLWSGDCSNNVFQQDVLMGREAKREAIMTEERMITTLYKVLRRRGWRGWRWVDEVLFDHNAFYESKMNAWEMRLTKAQGSPHATHRSLFNG